MIDRADGIRAIKANKSAKAKSKPIAKRSEKMKATINDLKKLYPIFLAAHPVCIVGAPGCTGKTTDIHHKSGRGKDKIKDDKTWLSLCRNCHVFIENNDEWSRENGFKNSRLTK